MDKAGRLDVVTQQDAGGSQSVWQTFHRRWDYNYLIMKKAETENDSPPEEKSTIEPSQQRHLAILQNNNGLRFN